MGHAKLRTLAHLSDLHIGRSPMSDAGAEDLVAALVATQVDHVVVTGDVTHRGRKLELARFRALFAPLAGRLTVVPGNHDRQGDDVAAEIMDARVDACAADGLHLVRVDSTSPHNRSWLASHGVVAPEDIARAAALLGARRADSLPVLLLHHHVLPLPGEDVFEKLGAFLGLPTVGELATGWALLGAIAGACQLVLHGHRHVPAWMRILPGAGPAVSVYNAGGSSELKRARVFTHVRGALVGRPRWLFANAVRNAHPERVPAVWQPGWGTTA